MDTTHSDAWLTRDELLHRTAQWLGPVRCGWCQRLLRPAVDPTLPVSHGICADCQQRFVEGL